MIVVWLTFLAEIDGPIRSAHRNLARVSMPAIPQFYPAFAPTTLRQDSAVPHPHGLPEKVVKCFSTRGSNCISAVMTKIFICDESRIRHHDAVFEGCDFTDCYNRIAHNVAGISLRAWSVPQPAVNILLKTIETMRFNLRTGFGETKQSYGGTHEQRLAGYGQGNAASGPGFTALSSLIIKANISDGYGAQICLS